MRMQQNEYLFLENLICTIFWVICSKMHCVLMQNAMRFGAKQTAFWCKMRCDLLLNARQFAAKYRMKCINLL